MYMKRFNVQKMDNAGLDRELYGIASAVVSIQK